MAHDLIWVENRRTPKVVSKGAKYEPKPSEGRITKRRAATQDEERTIRNGGWVRVNEKGDKPGNPGYMKKKSKVRPQHNQANDIEAFAAERDETLSDLAEQLLGPVTEALTSDNIADALMDVALTAYEDRGGDEPIRFAEDYTEAFDRTTADSNPERIANWLATAVVNAAAVDNEPGLDKVWVTMRDSDVRDTHRLMEGTRARAKEPFTVAGFQLQYPGQPIGPPEIWINCRCVVKPEARVDTELTAAADEQPVDETEIDAEAPEPEQDDPGFEVDDAKFHGVLCVEGKPTGDKREFAPESLEWRDLPIPFRWQTADTGGHDGAEVVGRIDSIWREGDELRYEGTWANTESADNAIGLVAEEHQNGVSVDVDMAEMSLVDAEGAAVDDSDPYAPAPEGAKMLLTKGRISAATGVAIPAFAEAYVALGPWPDEGQEFRSFDKATRDKLAEEGKAMPDGSFPIVNEDDLRNAIQAIGRASDPEAAKTHIKKRAADLDKTDLIPDTWAEEALAADGEEFKRGKGWVTHPRETSRLWRYWTKGKGAAKIRWGQGGDFYRCRRQLAKYIGPAYINRTCAQWHKDAIGIWPGEHKARSATVNDCADCDNSVRLVASAEPKVLPYTAFTYPDLNGPTPVTVTDDGYVYGHIATWSTCHIGFADTCVTAPQSNTGYAYFHTGTVLTDGGEVPVGQLTMNTGHADLSVKANDAAAHYDHTGAAIADVHVGEDEHGIWFAGMLRDGVTDEQVHALRAAALSGDWRGIGGNLELVAALVVNVPGFPIPRPSLAAAGGKQVSLIAAEPVRPVTPDHGQINALAAAVEQRLTERDQARALANRQRVERARAVKERI